MNKETMEDLRAEFNQLRCDDENFAYLYGINEFKEWLKDYNLI